MMKKKLFVKEKGKKESTEICGCSGRQKGNGIKEGSMRKGPVFMP